MPDPDYRGGVHSGRVLSLHRWPVKSMGGEDVEVLEVDGRGALGDRARALWDVARDKRLTAREAPGLLAWSARSAGDTVRVEHAGAAWDWEDADLPGALAGHLGREVRLDHDPQGIQDLPGTLLVTTQATLDDLDPAWRDLRRFRTNVHLALDAPAWAEGGWESRRMTLGDVELELLHPCVRCVIPTRDPDTQVKDARLLRWLTRSRDQLFGINARVIRPGVLRAGDPVSLL